MGEAFVGKFGPTQPRAPGQRSLVYIAPAPDVALENLAETLATFVTLASIQLALRRLARAQTLTPVE